MEVFTKQLTRQKTIIEEICSNLDVSSKKIESSFQNLTHTLEFICNSWKNVLPTELYCRSLGLLINVVIERLSDSILSLRSINDSEALNMKYLFQRLSKKAESFYDFKKETIPITKFVINWPKFRKIIEILETSLISNEFQITTKQENFYSELLPLINARK